jgi:hypothetical protein
MCVCVYIYIYIYEDSIMKLTKNCLKMCKEQKEIKKYNRGGQSDQNTLYTCREI